MLKKQNTYSSSKKVSSSSNNYTPTHEEIDI